MECIVALNGRAPQITIVAASEPEGELAERARFHRDRLATDGSFDGDKLLAHTIDADGTIAAFVAPFSTVLAMHELTRAGRADETLSFSLGPIGISALIENEHGQTLWGKRHGASVGGGAWHVIPAGMYDAGRDPQLMLLQEAEEELGLQPTDFTALEPLLVVHVVEQLTGVQIVYHAAIADTADLQLNPAEHSEVRWVDFPGELEPVLGQGLGIWHARNMLAHV